MKKSTPPTAEHKTLDKAMQILHSFSHEHPELSVGELSARLGIHKSVVSRLAGGLRAWGLLEQNPQNKQFRVGAEAFRLGAVYSNLQGLRQVAMPHMQALVETTRHACHLGILDGLTLLIVATQDSPNVVRVIMRLGDRHALHSTAAGKLMLAFVPGLLDRFLTEGPPLPLTPSTTVSQTRLKADLEAIRIAKFASNDEENTPGAGAVAAPVFGPDGTLSATLSIAYPIGAISASERRNLAPKIKLAARDISRAIAAQQAVPASKFAD